MNEMVIILGIAVIGFFIASWLGLRESKKKAAT